jgi:metalloendopeptidase OMA1, mitochondrial
MIKRFRFILLFIGTALIMSACQTVPITGRSQMLFTSPQEEGQLGDQAWAEIKRKERETKDKQYSEAVTRVGKNIAAVANAPGFQWEFKTFESTQANAFCLPGGKVAVYTGIFKYMNNDAELAAVVGHEIGHAIARHGGERISQEYARTVGQSLLSTLTDEQYRQLAVSVYGGATQVGIMLPYSRTHEYEADHIGIILMARAGYNPRYAITFWQKFAASSKTSALDEFLSTHPIGDKRIEEMRQLLPAALDVYDKAKVHLNTGVVYKK